MENINNNIIEKLNHLIAITQYSQNKYINAEANVENETIKKSLLQNAIERAANITELQSLIKSLGEFHNEAGTMRNNSNHQEADVKPVAILTNGSLINECIAGDDALRDAYNEALAGNKIFGSIRNVLIDHLSSIKNTIEHLRIYLKKAS